MPYFKGADRTAYNTNWIMHGEVQEDEMLNRELPVLRERSNALVRDNLIISGMQQAYINNILSYGPSIYSVSKNRIQREQINSFLEDRLEDCDITRTKSLQRILEEIVGSSFSDGDICINLPLVERKTVVELVEAFRIDTPTNLKDDKIRLGVEYADDGSVKGYWIQKPQPVGSIRRIAGSKDYEFFPRWKEHEGERRKVTDLFRAPLNAKPMASRQYPAVTPALQYIKNIDDYNEAVIIGARVAACFAGFVTTTNPAGAAKAMSTGEDPKKENRVARLQPGMLSYLAKGEEITFASPNKPGDNYDSFILRAYKTISMGLRIPYILAFLDTEQVSYSSWRGAVIDSSKLIFRWRRELNKIILWIVNTFLLEGIALGEIRGSLSTTEIRIRWPAIGILDPEKENRGNKIAHELGIKSKRMTCDEQGYDYDEVQQDIQEEAIQQVETEALVLLRKKELEKKYGIVYPENAKQDRDTTEDPDTTDPSDEDKKEKRKDDGNW